METNMKQLPHIILETANFHGGDISQLKQAIDTFSQLDYPDMGIKFHAFKPDNLEITEALEKLKLTGKELVINISGKDGYLDL